jgi:tetratricopeptide (TPR) repeat protein
VRLAAIAARKDNTTAPQAMAIYDSVIDVSADPRVLAETWLDKGEALLAAKSYEPALMALLHIPVFYPDQRLLMPRALLGSARAFKGLEDFDRARDQLNELPDSYGASPESAAAKDEEKEVDKLEKQKKG